MQISMRRIVLRSAARPGLTRRDYWLAAGAAEVVTMSSFVLSTIASSLAADSPQIAATTVRVPKMSVSAAFRRVPGGLGLGTVGGRDVAPVRSSCHYGRGLTGRCT
jgi:hypothetical protein